MGGSYESRRKYWASPKGKAVKKRYRDRVVRGLAGSGRLRSTMYVRACERTSVLLEEDNYNEVVPEQDELLADGWPEAPTSYAPKEAEYGRCRICGTANGLVFSRICGTCLSNAGRNL